MTQIERYIFRIALSAFLACLIGLTGTIWVTQALRELDLITAKGQTLLIFLFVTGLSLPTLVVVIAPMALFIAVIYALNKLNGDSELIVMSAAGMTPRGLLRPFTMTLTVSRDGGGFRAAGDGIVKLSAYGIEQPAQFGVRTRDDVKLHLDFTARPSGGSMVRVGGSR